MSKSTREKMNHMVEVVCDKCGKPIKTYTKELYFNSKTKLRVEGFECRHCGAVYVTLISDNKLRGLIHEVQEDKDKLTKAVREQSWDYKYYAEHERKVPDEVVKRWEDKIVKMKKDLDKKVQYNKSYELLLRVKYLDKEGEVRDYVYSNIK